MVFILTYCLLLLFGLGYWQFSTLLGRPRRMSRLWPCNITDVSTISIPELFLNDDRTCWLDVQTSEVKKRKSADVMRRSSGWMNDSTKTSDFFNTRDSCSFSRLPTNRQRWFAWPQNSTFLTTCSLSSTWRFSSPYDSEVAILTQTTIFF